MAKAAVQVLIDENLAERAQRLGEIFRSELRALQSPVVELVRGKGLLNAVVIKPHGKNAKGEPRTGYDVAHDLVEYGVLAKQTHVHTIRFAPPLVITETELEQGIEGIKTAIRKSCG